VKNITTKNPRQGNADFLSVLEVKELAPVISTANCRTPKNLILCERIDQQVEIPADWIQDG